MFPSNDRLEVVRVWLRVCPSLSTTATRIQISRHQLEAVAYVPELQERTDHSGDDFATRMVWRTVMVFLFYNVRWHFKIRQYFPYNRDRESPLNGVIVRSKMVVKIERLNERVVRERAEGPHRIASGGKRERESKATLYMCITCGQVELTMTSGAR
ncbi:hypothetical protein SISNIDRAFT_314955 [Sistotremastrum niveocremeum HHB9708]|uniref:Uncharacterized protein n=1 Tax=Sistotremastrum niveocremeum HHB9708 TaxID=1314777 RepID=A0A164XZD3_9AGAM|nr:hypothetical protein SISNIDRAFT_314955 [Sistotremastrum niveocremeum HHB9708]